MSDMTLYPNATPPTAPRFQVGELVYTRSSQCDSVVEPAVFGVIIEAPDVGTVMQDSETIAKSWQREWDGIENPTEEAVIDLPGSGSVWFLPDNERKYFVKWMNKETYPVNTQPTEFRPMMSNGEPLFNISLHFEGSLYKAPKFIAKLRSKVAQRKEMSDVLAERLNIDDCSTQGITGMVMEY
jgi:hypothetical protein